MSLINRLKLARLLMKFAELETDNGKLVYEGELQVGTEVFIDNGEELIPVPDGEYSTKDKIFVMVDGKVSEIKEIEENEPQKTPESEEMEDEKIAELEAKIVELEAIIAERDARIAELEALLVEKEEQLSMSVAKPAHVEVKDVIITNKENKALKYFK